jgi:hypothetical protein
VTARSRGSGRLMYKMAVGVLSVSVSVGSWQATRTVPS